MKYNTPEERRAARKASVRKYQQSPKGQAAMKRAQQNYRLSQSPDVIRQIASEQERIRREKKPCDNPKPWWEPGGSSPSK